jgi:hypothetical protein
VTLVASGRIWNREAVWRVQTGMDDIEREAIRAEGYDPDDPAVLAALERGARHAEAGWRGWT